MVDMFRDYPVGSLWSSLHGDKCGVLGYDPVSDQLLGYNYRTKKEFWVTCTELEDKLVLKEPWDATVAFERGLFQGLRPGFESGLRESFDVAAHEEGQPVACHSFEKSDGFHAEPYTQYFIKLNLHCASQMTLTSGVQSLIQTIRFDMGNNKITKMVWRTHPETTLAHDEITGERFLKIYARFVAFSHNECVPAEKFLGHIKRNA